MVGNPDRQKEGWRKSLSTAKKAYFHVSAVTSFALFKSYIIACYFQIFYRETYLQETCLYTFIRNPPKSLSKFLLKISSYTNNYDSVRKKKGNNECCY